MNDPQGATAAPARGPRANRAVGGGDVTVPSERPTALGVPRTSTGRSRRRLAVVAVVLAGAFGTVLAFGLGSSLNYFETVDQALAHKASLGTTTFRLEGVVVPGSIRRSGSAVAFVVTGTKDRVAVVNHGSPPQLFQPNVPVVVVGHFDGATFVSNQVIVDHSAQYVEQHPNRVKAPNGTLR